MVKPRKCMASALAKLTVEEVLAMPKVAEYRRTGHIFKKGD
jgi:hypothetical protein